MILYDREGKPINVATGAEATDLLLNGSHGLPGTERVPVADPSGRVGTMLASDLRAALGKGYRILDDREIKAAKAGYGGGAVPTPEQQAGAEAPTGEVVARGAMRAMSGLTAGLSDVGFKAMAPNMDPEALAAADEALGGLGTGLEIGGAVLPALATAGGSAAATGARGGIAAAAKAAPISMLARGGAAATEALAKRGVSRLPAAIAGGVVEGAPQLAGAELGREVLADEPVSGTKILAAGGIGGLLGGGASGAFSLLGVLGDSAAASARGLQPNAAPGAAGKSGPKTLDSALGAIEREVGADELNLLGKMGRALGLENETAESLSRLTRMGAEGANARSLAMSSDDDVQKIVESVADAFQKHDDAFTAATKQIETLVKPQEIEGLVRGADAQTVRTSTDSVVQEIRKIRAELNAHPEIYQNHSRIGKFENVLDALEKNLDLIPRKHAKSGRMVPRRALAPFEVWKALDDAKGQFAEISDFGREALGEAGAKTTRKRVRDAWGMIQRNLEEPTVWGPAAPVNAKWNNALSELLKARKYLLKNSLLGMVDANGKRVVSARRVQRFLELVQSPDADEKRKAIAGYLRASQNVADIATTHPQLKRVLETTFGKTADGAKVGKLVADWERLRGNTARATTVWGNVAARVKLPGTRFLGIVPTPGLSSPVTVLHLLDKLRTRSEGAIRAAAKLAGKAQGARRVAVPAMIAALDTPFGPDRNAKKPASMEEAFLRRSGEVMLAAGDKPALMQQIAPVLKHISGAGERPIMAEAMGARVSVLADFLASKLPKDPLAGGRPLSGPARGWKPSHGEMARFARYYSAAMNPLAVLESVSTGHVSVEAAEAMQVVHADILEEFRNAVLDEAKAGAAFPYKVRRQLSTLFGEPWDPSMRPEFIRTMQALKTPQPQDSDSKMPRQPRKKMRSTDNMRPESDRLAAS